MVGPESLLNLRMVALGKCGTGETHERIAKARQLWADTLLVDGTPTRWSNDQWHIGVYKGMPEIIAQEYEQVQSMFRKRSIRDTVDHSAAAELQKASAEVQGKWLEDQHNATRKNFPAPASSHLHEGLITDNSAKPVDVKLDKAQIAVLVRMMGHSIYFDGRDDLGMGMDG